MGRAASGYALLRGGAGAAGTSLRSLGDMAALAEQQQREHLIGLSMAPLLPRDPLVYESGAFNPHLPLKPMPIDRPRDGLERPEPRIWQYNVGYNLPSHPGDIKLVQFAQLRAFADIYDVARACIEHRKSHIVDLDWDIVVSDPAALDDGGKQYDAPRAVFREFWQQPDRNFTGFSGWLSAVIEDFLVLDAVALYPARSRTPQGRTGSGIAEIQVIDAATIKPLVDIRGGKPAPPCYSQDTEILTRRGWLPFADLTEADEVATRSPEGRFQWQRPTRLIAEPYRGRMIHFTGRTVDCLVTPNHRMLTTIGSDEWRQDSHRDRARDEKGHFTGWRDGTVPGTQRTWLLPAESLLRYQEQYASPARLVAISTWDAPELRAVDFTPDGALFRYAEEAAEAADPLAGRARSLTMTGDDYAAFMGAYLAEGSVLGAKYDYRISISQTERGKGYAAYRDLLTRIMGREPGRNGGNWSIYNKALSSYLAPLGGARGKYIPREVLDLPQRQLELFWHAYWLGDGAGERAVQAVATTSRALADGLQEVIQKLGGSASVSADRTGIYRLRRRTTPYPEASAQAVDYDGVVYCVTVPDSVVYVRRNGKAIWSGNSPAYQQYLWGITRNELIQTIMRGGKLDPEQLRDKEGQRFLSDQLIYLRRTERSFTPYGFSPLEQAIVTVLTALKREEWLIKYFEDGSLPEAFIMAPEGWTPEQMRVFEDMLNDVGSADIGQRHRMRMLPNGSDPQQIKAPLLTSELDKFLLEKTCAAFRVTPFELGFAPAQGLGGKGYGDSQENVQQRKALLPDKNYLERVITRISHDILGMPRELAFSFIGYDPKEDLLKQAQIDQIEVQLGKRTIDELRERDGQPAFHFPLTSSPFVVTREGLTPLDPDAPLPPALLPQQPIDPAQGPMTPAQAGNTAKPTQSRAIRQGKTVSGQGNGSAAKTQKPTQSAGQKGADSDDEPDPDPERVTLIWLAAEQERARELRTLRRYLAKHAWAPRRSFEATLLYADEAERAESGPEALDQLLKDSDERLKRLAALAALEEALGQQVAERVTAGDRQGALDALADGFGRAYRMGAGHWGEEPVGTASDAHGRQLAERKRRWLDGFLAASAAGELSDAQLRARAGLYAAALWAPYQLGLKDYAPDGTYWRWEAMADACELCAPRDGVIYSEATLPGVPGEAPCLGFDKCRCHLAPVSGPNG